MGVQIGPHSHLTDLAYADDLVLFGCSFEAVEKALQDVCKFARMAGLEINASKTKVMASLVPSDQHSTITLEGQPIEEVDSFVYLGSKCMMTGQGSMDVDRRISLARYAFSSLQKSLWSRREISTRTKSRI